MATSYTAEPEVNPLIECAVEAIELNKFMAETMWIWKRRIYAENDARKGRGH